MKIEPSIRIAYKTKNIGTQSKKLKVTKNLIEKGRQTQMKCRLEKTTNKEENLVYNNNSWERKAKNCYTINFQNVKLMTLKNCTIDYWAGFSNTLQCTK